MGNSTTKDQAVTSSLMDFAPSPTLEPGFPSHAPLVEQGLGQRSYSLVSIHNEMNDILNMVSRIIVAYIKNGPEGPCNEASKAFNEDLYLKQKYV